MSLSDDDVREIFERRAKGATWTELATAFHVTPATLQQIFEGTLHDEVDVGMTVEERQALGKRLPKRRPYAPQRRLTEAIVRDARDLYGAGTTLEEIADKHHVSTYALRNAIRGVTWSHIQDPPAIPYESKAPVLNEDQVAEARDLRAKGVSFAALADRYGVSYTAVRRAILRDYQGKTIVSVTPRTSE